MRDPLPALGGRVSAARHLRPYGVACGAKPAAGLLPCFVKDRLFCPGRGGGAGGGLPLLHRLDRPLRGAGIAKRTARRGRLQSGRAVRRRGFALPRPCTRQPEDELSNPRAAAVQG